MENQGFELSLESEIVSKKDFTWAATLNSSVNRNKVIELAGEDYKDIGTGDGGLKTGPIHRLIIGEPIGIFYGYVADGIFQNEQEISDGPTGGPTNWVGGRRYKDISGPDGIPDGKIDATYDRKIIGDPNPDFIGGLTNNFRYKNISLSVFMQWSVGNDMFNYNNIELTLPSAGQNASKELVTDRWSESNTDANVHNCIYKPVK